MKKKVLISLLVIASVSLGTLGLATASASASNVKRVSSSSIKKSGITHDFYRLKKATSGSMNYYVKRVSSEGESYIQFKSKRVVFPKGMIVDAQKVPSNKGSIYLSGKSIDLSYKLKRKLVGPNVDSHSFTFKYSPKVVSKINRPTYMLPYGNNILFSGGISGLSQYGDYKSNALKLTSDGYIEYYKYSNISTLQNLGGVYAPQPIPTESVRIRHSVMKQNKLYLYYARKITGISDKKVNAKGPYKYRLVIVNQHTPYRLNNDISASMYTVGNQHFFTFVTGSKE
ncbi:hypothetical protein [Lentilactobacillus otakiensis]|uniref:hypothetical protein n=1 Tax=Lentilactobacillus otakiensis TaxID=481720 RepID=UPI003D17CAC5